MDVCSGAGHDYHSRASEFTPVLSWVRVALSFAFFVMFCRSLYVRLSFFFIFGYRYCLSFDLRVLITSLYLQTFLSVHDSFLK
jgi:hypothetical protein